MNLPKVAVSNPIHFESPGRRRVTTWDIWAGVVPFLALLPMLIFQSQALTSSVQTQFFPLVIVAVGGFSLSGWFGGESTHPVRRWTAVGMLILATAVYLWAVWDFSPWFSQLAAILVFFAWALGRCGKFAWTTIAAWTALLLTTWPLPMSLDVQLTQRLLTATSWVCGEVLDGVGIPYLRLDKVIQVRGDVLHVQEACMDIGSLYALMALGIFVLIVQHRSLFVSVLCLLSVPVWMVVGNFVRLMAIILAREFYGRDLAHGADHQLLGLAVFLLAASCFWLTQSFIARMLRPVPVGDPEFAWLFSVFNRLLCWPLSDSNDDMIFEDDEDLAGFLQMKKMAEERRWTFEPIESAKLKWTNRSAYICCALLLTSSVAPAIVLARSRTNFAFGVPRVSEVELQSFPGESALPENSGALKRIDYRRQRRSATSCFGQNSIIWDYAWEGQIVQASLDFPFKRWHALEQCYAMSGHRVESYEIKGSNSDASGEIWPWVEVELLDDLGSYSYLFFALFDDNLQPYSRIPGLETEKASGEQMGIMRELSRRSSEFSTKTYQYQLLCQPGEPLSANQKAELRNRFLELRNSVRTAADEGVRLVAGR